MTGIETDYGGATFRSRLEARWAAFFDLIGWRWVYEPWDGNGYIPDFIVLGARPLLIEVKPDITTSALQQHVATVEAGIRGHWQGDYAIVGASPLPVPDHKFAATMFNAAAGIIGQWDDDWGADADAGWSDDLGEWTRCRDCRSLAIFHTIHSFACRPCGHYEGDHLLGNPRADCFTVLWNRAHQLTRWK